MDFLFKTLENSTIALTPNFHEDPDLVNDETLYKMIWVQEGTVKLRVDHIEMTLQANELLTLSPSHLLEITNVDGEYLTYVFSRDFYNVLEHEEEIPCVNFLFFGVSDAVRLVPSEEKKERMLEILRLSCRESGMKDRYEEEMLRGLLKMFLIYCVRLLKEKFQVTTFSEKDFEVVGRFYWQVELNYKKIHVLKEYRPLVNCTCSAMVTIFPGFGLSAPKVILRERIVTEAKRILIRTNKNVDYISSHLGFKDSHLFCLFFSNMTRENYFSYRKRENPNWGK